MENYELKKAVNEATAYAACSDEGFDLNKYYVGDILTMTGISKTKTFTQALLLNSGFKRKRGQVVNEIHVKGDPEKLNYVITTNLLENPVTLRKIHNIPTEEGFSVHFMTTNLDYNGIGDVSPGELYILDFETGRLFHIKNK